MQNERQWQIIKIYSTDFWVANIIRNSSDTQMVELKLFYTHLITIISIIYFDKSNEILEKCLKKKEKKY
jgi:hypothetical protein